MESFRNPPGSVSFSEAGGAETCIKNRKLTDSRTQYSIHVESCFVIFVSSWLNIPL